jgi:hypothetical protein
LNFLERFSNNTQIKFYENPSSGSRVVLFHAGGETVMTKLIVACRNFANAPKKIKAHVCPIIFGFIRTLLFEDSQASPIYHSGKSSFKMTMSVER